MAIHMTSTHMKSAMRLLAFVLLFQAIMASGAFDPALAGVCLPNSTRFTKCVDGKAAQCTRSRNIKCKTREKCIQTEQPCDLPALIR
jgi:hypothetical protein